MMRVVKKLLFACVMTVGLTVVASAQKDQDRPPKDPPVVNPGTKPQPTPQPTPPKKPNYAIVLSNIETKQYSV